MQTKYNPVTPEICEKLVEIVGEYNVILDDENKLEAYSHDEVADLSYAHLPEIVVKPTTAEQISEIMKLANREMIPVTPRGAGSGLSGGAVPVFGGILLSVEKMNQIIEVDTDNLIAVVEPGVVTNEINEQVKEHNLFFAGYPMSVEACYIGGNVAENAGGGKAIKYGVTGRYIMGLEVVLPSGEIVQFGGKCVKNVSGYDMVNLMVGSEGTLGIFTKIFIKLLPLPKTKADLLVLFKTTDEAIGMVPRIMTTTGIIPTTVEFMDQLSIKTSCEYLNESLPYQDAGAMLLIEIDGTDRTQVEYEFETVGDLCQEHGAIEVYVATNHTTQERIWSVRRNIAEAFKVYSPIQSLEDVVVPFADIPKILPVLDELSREFDVVIPCYGHAGDGNLHVTIIKKPEMSLDVWAELEPKILTALYKKVICLGGSISGEHGIGSKRKQYLELMMSPAVMSLQKRIKQVFDPNNILNPGKIFP
jgi:glycolate oxidase